MKPRVAVVGTCASGKSSVSQALVALGFDAYAVSQEHSGVPELWKHLHPDIVLYLDNSLATLRRRRGNDAWPEWIYETQLKRLTSARAHAIVVISTDDLELDAVIGQAVAMLREISSADSSGRSDSSTASISH